MMATVTESSTRVKPSSPNCFRMIADLRISGDSMIHAISPGGGLMHVHPPRQGWGFTDHH